MLLTFLLSSFLMVPPAQAAPPQAPPDVETCLSCHGDKSLSVTLPSGETRPLFVDVDTFRKSVHGNKLSCTDCHQDMMSVPHEARPFKTLRDFTLAYYEQCKRCHFANYTKTLDSVHFKALERRDRMAPTCVDCHGAHDIAASHKPKASLSKTCAKCHQGVFEVYAKSVHGRFLEQTDDVPGCTDCHKSHDVAGPRDTNWQKRTPELCSSCHANKSLMEKYGISTAVSNTYVADFHGMTASLQGSGTPRETSVVALCTDCHGVHDIAKVNEPGSRVLRANLVKTCARCHEGASDNFPAAWMSHYEPSWEKAPLVYGVQLFYDILIPFMVAGLLLQILLHFWRMVVNR
ncbi:MAG: cytochrome c3 family protein [Vicinamibacterales bacterium]|jgi:predicted CXXCH cytochrome family protein|nr:cytochrome c3 family protein [Vicinamibacterales bacterium]